MISGVDDELVLLAKGDPGALRRLIVELMQSNEELKNTLLQAWERIETNKDFPYDDKDLALLKRMREAVA